LIEDDYAPTPGALIDNATQVRGKRRVGSVYQGQANRVEALFFKNRKTR